MKTFKNPLRINIQDLIEHFVSQVFSDSIYFSINSQNGMKIRLEYQVKKIELTEEEKLKREQKKQKNFDLGYEIEM